MTAPVALAWARGHIGVAEDPPGSDNGPQINAWQERYDVAGLAWCGAFAGHALLAAGIDVPRGIVWVPTIEEWARTGTHGFSWHTWEDRAPGDLVVFGFGEDGRANHVGLLDEDRIHTIEGNTPADERGGTECVARRRRDPSQVRGCARPPWPG
jgi:hypothetical protein